MILLSLTLSALPVISSDSIALYFSTMNKTEIKLETKFLLKPFHMSLKWNLCHFKSLKVNNQNNIK